MLVETNIEVGCSSSEDSDGDDMFTELRSDGQQQHQQCGINRPLSSTLTHSGSSNISHFSSCSTNSSRSSTRVSRFNNIPVMESPLLSARGYFSTPGGETMNGSLSSDGTGSRSTRDSLNLLFTSTNKSLFQDSENKSPDTSIDTNHSTKAINQPSKQIINNNDKVSDKDTITQEDSPPQSDHTLEKNSETAQEILERRMNRIDPNFFKENPPTVKVPRFFRNELSLGDQLGEGEFGSVFAIETLERQPPPCLDLKKVIEKNEILHQNKRLGSDLSNPEAVVHASHTLPVANDLIVGPGNLDNYLKRRVEAFNDQESDLITPTIMDKDIQPTRLHSDTTDIKNNQQLANHPSKSNSEDDNTDDHAMAKRRPGVKLKDRKGQMIHKQNNVDDFDGYVVKMVRNDIPHERQKRVAAADMATEAKLLSALHHPNIMTIRGIMGYIEQPGNYGIIMDKLKATLQDQILEWAKITAEDDVPRAAPEKHPLLEHTPKWMLIHKEKVKLQKHFRQTEFYVERMEATLDVLRAMRYLHEKHIIFRDLKPENVGLTKDHYVLFDFGLSRELKKSDQEGLSGDQYHATGLTGSRLFMAPEVALLKPYGFSADVYSFAILFWEVVSLKEVFPHMTMNKHYKQVIVKGKRPASLEAILPSELNQMMVSSWDKDPTKRPTFESIFEIVSNELEKFDDQKSSTFIAPFNVLKSDLSLLKNERKVESEEVSGRSLTAKEFGKHDGYYCSEEAKREISNKPNSFRNLFDKMQDTVVEKLHIGSTKGSQHPSPT